MLKSLKLKLNLNSCEECVLAKSTQHINHKISNNKSLTFLDLVKFDLFGPIYIKDFKNKYFITFLDEYSIY